CWAWRWHCSASKPCWRGVFPVSRCPRRRPKALLSRPVSGRVLPVPARNPRQLKIHILGIAGTFMGGVAALAREAGTDVEGSDQAVYPPISTQLERLGITLRQGYAPEHVADDVDEVIVGNALSRGNPAVEALLDSGRRYT